MKYVLYSVVGGILAFWAIAMIIATLGLATGCSTLPDLYKGVEEVATNNAVDISLSKEIIDSGKNLNIAIELNDCQE